MESRAANEALPYAVIKFLNDDDYSEIPTNWICKNEDKIQAWWPVHDKKITSLISNGTNPELSNKAWKIFDVEVIKYFSSLELARKSAADSNYVTADEEAYGRGRRMPIPVTLISTDEDENYNVEIQVNKKQYSQTIKKKIKNKMIENTHGKSCLLPFPPCPIVLTGTENWSSQTETEMEQRNIILAENKRASFNLDCINLDEIPIDIQSANVGYIVERNNYKEKEAAVSYNTRTSFGPSDTNDTNFDKHLQKILRLLAGVNVHLQSIDKRLSNLEKPNTQAINDIGLIEPLLPLKGVDEINEFEGLIKTKQAAFQFKNFVSKIGGNCGRGNVHRALKKVFTNRCAIHYSWKGHRNNLSASKLYLVTIIRNVVCSEQGITEAAFDNHASDWIRFAKQRELRDANKNVADKE